MRLVRHLSFSNVIAVIALFIALGGAAYAGSKINGKNIVNKSIGGGKLKNETITANKIKKGTITSAQIAPGSIDSTQININTLTTVPSAQTATTATSAKTAETATKATSAVTADEAGEAKEADSAKHAKEADTATNATHAAEADRATIAGEAEKLNGKTASQLTLACPEKTEFYGGMCWDKTTRTAKLWLGAIKECGEAGGRLPSIAELIAFVLRPEEQVSEQVWSADLIDSSVGEGEVFTTDENGRAKTGPGLHGFRCVFPKTN